MTFLTSYEGVYELRTTSVPRTLLSSLEDSELEDALRDNDVRHLAVALLNVEEGAALHSIPLTSPADVLAFGLAFAYGSAISLAAASSPTPAADPLTFRRSVQFGYRVATTEFSRDASVLQVTSTLLRGSGAPSLSSENIDELADIMLSLEVQPIVAEVNSPPQLKELKATVAAQGAAAAAVYYVSPEHGPTGVLLAAGTVVLISMSVSVSKTVSKLINTLGDEMDASLRRRLRARRKPGKRT